MTDSIRYCEKMASGDEVASHLRQCDSTFVPPLSSRVDIASYADKIVHHARRFEAWGNGVLLGLVAAYCNSPDKISAFITSVSVLPSEQGRGIASHLLIDCIRQISKMGFAQIGLEVDCSNHAARLLYRKHGFICLDESQAILRMTLNLKEEPAMNPQRDYNAETSDVADHRYAYGFDFDVMHPFMVRTFEPFFRAGSLLELGSFKGDFTRRLLAHFDDVTCVEASGDALSEAKEKLGDKATFIHALFENVSLPHRYDNIVLTHVLEHLDDPVRVLKRINDEWLAEGGRFFLVCPNANAPSRQIAVKMGLISHNTAVTPAEAEHGHRCTYTLDTLERDATLAGLKVVHRSGIFFKALANFQWDRLLNTDIISPEYLEGCYMLGQQYPDLCSSIFLLCESGRNDG